MEQKESNKGFSWDRIVLAAMRRGLFNWMTDRQFLKLKFKHKMGKKLDLNNPQTFSEKLQWLKLYNRRPEYTMMVDKYRVREYIAEKLGEEYLIPLLGVWDDPDEIDFDALPDQFVLKCNHNSGLGMCICKDKSRLDIPKVRDELRRGLKENYYMTNREWPYKDVPRKIICEKYMEKSSGEDISDYKLMCFNGKVKCILYISDRFTKSGEKITFFDTDWNVLPIRRKCPQTDRPIARPENYEQMIQFAEYLSKNQIFDRIDFYEIDGKLYFGEITFFPGSGFEKFYPDTADAQLGQWINLPLNREGRL